MRLSLDAAIPEVVGNRRDPPVAPANLRRVGQEVEALAVVQPLLGRAAADLQFLDAWSKAAGQVFDERDCGRV
jgi:hypothetical protein